MNTFFALVLPIGFLASCIRSGDPNDSAQSKELLAGGESQAVMVEKIKETHFENSDERSILDISCATPQDDPEFLFKARVLEPTQNRKQEDFFAHSLFQAGKLGSPNTRFYHLQQVVKAQARGKQPDVTSLVSAHHPSVRPLNQQHYSFSNVWFQFQAQEGAAGNQSYLTATLRLEGAAKSKILDEVEESFRFKLEDCQALIADSFTSHTAEGVPRGKMVGFRFESTQPNTEVKTVQFLLSAVEAVLDDNKRVKSQRPLKLPAMVRTEGEKPLPQNGLR